ncbi:hypothetical protein [Streptomyces lydicus]|uniref:hypothetical protein n=1 Tax=Streptomyces lydicus TaxID=47763 RepID=UPI00287005CF|nr:hypothetical protein [Streptomyces lydicus]
MYASPDDFDQQPSPPGSAQARERGLRRSRRLTRWIAVAAVSGAAALGSLYTHLLPGSSAPSAPSSPPVQNPAAPSDAAPKPSNDGEHGNTARHEDDDAGQPPAAQPGTPPAPQPPAHPPTPTQQRPHTTTGAS